MINFLTSLLSAGELIHPGQLHLPAGFMPHGMCYLWKPGLVWLHVVSDSLVALAYYSIPITLIYFVQHRRDLPFRWIFWLFGAFIIACGTTHIMEVWTLWHPNYWVAGIIKAFTAIVSLYTAVQLIPLLPQALALPSPTQLALINQNLEKQILERQKSEEALRQSEARYRAIVEDQTELICRFLPEGTLTFVNQAYCRYFGGTQEDLIGSSFCPMILEEDLEKVKAQLNALSKEKPIVTITHRILNSHGEIRTQQWSNRAIFDDQDSCVEIQAVGRDITKLKQAEEVLKAYSAQLEVRNRELQDFAYVASHDLQEPLRKIQTFGDRLKVKYGDVLNVQGRDYLERMHNAAKRMQTLIDDLLAISRVATQAQSFVKVNLATVATEVLCDLETRIESSGGSVDIGELPSLEADPTQMRQLLQNLIDNALKFSRPEESAAVKIRSQLVNQVEETPAGNISYQEFYQITVEDNGIGFEQKYLDKIFVPFQRLHSRSQYEGTGIGLAICRKIVDRHGGSITAKSSLGEGATFTVMLPVKQFKGGNLK
ncbi:PAS domain-containing sensor histidine kinase [Microcoleus sp. FACHB-68]|uniref:sensor histidine kinase n=1 Tax=Microcoleus sp. FACHB-68 TaxID=2692826 RepID=UPI001686181F|nr:PAS domain-containing sensor histidine kinase [Microcoleus sp. FACHB-68]MBD1939394.1 PAS domain S-box protein [Microcoleus sp. FACHB-68]